MKKYLLLMCFGLLLASCTSENPLQGIWVGIDEKGGSIEFKPNNKVVVDGISEREYTLSGNDLLIKWLSFNEEYKIEIRGKDTLLMTGLDSRRRYMREDAMGSKTERFALMIKKDIFKKTKTQVTSVTLREVDYEKVKDSVNFSVSSREKIKEGDKIYLGVIVMPNKAPMDIIVREGRSKDGLVAPLWEETFESMVKGMITESIKKICMKVEMKLVSGASYEGTATFEDSKTMNFTFDRMNGWLPKKDKASVQVFVEAYFLNRFGSHTVKSVNLESKDAASLSYTGVVEFSKGGKAAVSIDLTKSWLPLVPTDQATAELIAKYRITKDLSRMAQVVKATPTKSTGEYEVELKLDRLERNVRIVFNANQGWYPVNEVQNLSDVVKCQMSNGLESTFVEDVKLTKKTPTEYRGIAYFSSKDKKDIKVICEGQKFTWEIVKAANDKSFKSQLPPELQKELKNTEMLKKGGPRNLQK